MYIQIEEPEERRKKMKLVKQKPDENHSPRPRKIANNEGEVSDVSEVEPAPNTGHNMLRLNLKFDSLEDILERFQNQISSNFGEIRELQAMFLTKSSQKTLASYFERLQEGIHRDVGEKQHRYKLNDPAFLSAECECPEGQHLKASVEGFIDKLDIVSQAIVKLKKG